MPNTKHRLLIDAYSASPEEKEKVVAMLNQIIIEISGLELCSSVQISLTAEEGDREKNIQELSEDTKGDILYPELSTRQQEIAVLLASNYSVQKIANQLYISENTVRKHVQNIKKLLGIHASGVDLIYALKGR
ncbi:LuxR C-terminal-related transcriptional regulator [Paenibacillus sp. BR2-3]|uniref:LuxR C-terminal-related transcriptional regulator n=1 Tax=Paenibacillus sp. BR2-3 TaxID=3048494 RepID=UPI0039776D76